MHKDVESSPSSPASVQRCYTPRPVECYDSVSGAHNFNHTCGCVESLESDRQSTDYVTAVYNASVERLQAGQGHSIAVSSKAPRKSEDRISEDLSSDSVRHPFVRCKADRGGPRRTLTMTANGQDAWRASASSPGMRADALG